jgi:hypothetical protein
MKCDFCSADIPEGTELLSDGHAYCNALHRRAWHERILASMNAPGTAATPKGPALSSRRALWIAGAIAAVVIVGFILSVRSGLQHFTEAGDIDKQLMTVAMELNKSCPMILDKETRLDNAIALPGKKFVYNYSLINLSIDQVNIQQLREYIQPRVTNTVKTEPSMKMFRDNQVTMVYRYVDKAGVFVMEIPVTPDAYR